jgi:Ca-activated chloride channel family protein
VSGPSPDQPSGQEREQRQALDAMLRRVPDDPGGLLRQRFMLQHLQRSGQLP